VPKVSAIIPTRNRPELVCQAVRSVLNQSMTDVEAIVVIDGPDEASERALEKIPDPRLRVIALQQSVGGSEARNTGVRAATSKWIALLDDDDEWLPQKLELQLSAAERSGSDAVVSVTRFLMRTADGSESVWPQRFPLPGEPISEYLFCTSRNVFQTSTVLCSRSLFLEAPFTRGLKRLQDWDWLLRVLQRPEVVLETTPEVLSIYVVHAVTVSNAADWQGALGWANQNRTFFTPKAYSCFIAKKCAADARRQNASLGARVRLLRESFKGAPTPRSLAMFLVYASMLPENRQRLGDRLFGRVRGKDKRG
jgi:glycosyltransferase involved in cell wall biosynthesis